MNIVKKAFCRVFQMTFRLVLLILPYREPKIIHSCADLGTVLDEKNIKSVLIITDKGIRSHGLTASLESVLMEKKVSFSIYDGVQPNPTVRNVEEALLCYQQNNCDCLIAIGGGSSMDCAKAVGARVAYPRKSVGQMKGILRVLRKLPLLIAIPTTAGTGSEVTLAAVITDDEIQHKYCPCVISPISAASMKNCCTFS